MEGVTCPACKRMFCFTYSDDEDDDDCDRITCPFCLRDFDPYAPIATRAGTNESAGLDDLVDSSGDDANDDDEPDG